MYSCCILAKHHWEHFDTASNPQNTRSRIFLNVNFQRLTTTQKSVNHNVPLMYSSLPKVMRNKTKTMGMFKYYLKRHLLSSFGLYLKTASKKEAMVRWTQLRLH